MIYVLENDKGQVKIGFSRDAKSLKGRISTLRTAHPDRLKLLAKAEGDMDDEQRLHGLLKQYHIRREWFGYHEWMDPLMENVIALLPVLGAAGVLEHTEDNLRNFMAFPVVRGPEGYVDYPAKYAGIRIADLRLGALPDIPRLQFSHDRRQKSLRHPPGSGHPDRWTGRRCGETL